MVTIDHKFVITDAQKKSNINTNSAALLSRNGNAPH